MNIDLVLLVLALICFAVAALGIPSRVNLVAAGLFLVTLTQVI